MFLKGEASAVEVKAGRLLFLGAGAMRVVGGRRESATDRLGAECGALGVPMSRLIAIRVSLVPNEGVLMLTVRGILGTVGGSRRERALLER